MIYLLVIFLFFTLSFSQIYEVKNVEDSILLRSGNYKYYIIVTGKNSINLFNSKPLESNLNLKLSNGFFAYGNLILIEKGERETIKTYKVKNPCISPLLYLKYLDLSRIKETDPYTLLWLAYSLKEINLDVKSVISYLKSKSLLDFFRSLSLSLIFLEQEDLRSTYCKDIGYYLNKLNYISGDLSIYLIPDGFEDIIDVNVKIYFNGKFLNETTFKNVNPGEKLKIKLESKELIGNLLIDVSIYKKIVIGGGIYNAPQAIKHLTIVVEKNEEELLRESYLLGSNKFVKIYFFDGGINEDLKIGYKSNPLLSIYLYETSLLCNIKTNLEPLRVFISNLDESSLREVFDLITLEDIINFYFLYILDKKTTKIYTFFKNKLRDKLSYSIESLLEGFLCERVKCSEGKRVNYKVMDSIYKEYITPCGTILNDIKLTAMYLLVVRSYNFYCLEVSPILLSDNSNTLTIKNWGFKEEDINIVGCGVNIKTSVDTLSSKSIRLNINQKFCVLYVKTKYTSIPIIYEKSSLLKGNSNISLKDISLILLAIIAIVVSLLKKEKSKEEWVEESLELE